MRFRLILIVGLLASQTLLAATAPDIDERTRNLAKELRCVVCQNLSVADSPSEMAKQMREIIHEQLEAGKTPQEIKNFFVSKYGEWVLLAPEKSGFGLLVWVLPFAVLILGIGLGLWFVRRWSKQKSRTPQMAPDSTLLDRVRREAIETQPIALDLEDTSQRSQLLQERSRLYADLNELEFDYQAGKLSDSDYQDLRRGVEIKAAAVLQQLDKMAQNAPLGQTSKRAQTPVQSDQPVEKARLKGWQLAAGGVFLLLFGVTLGVALTKSLRPRSSEQDTVTGDFLTGTGPSGVSNDETASLLQEGKSAFAKQDWPKAIESFKKVLAADPNQPEAHTYMGFILIQAGHADGALMAFDRALSAAPNFPMALWGKGMTLYQEKKDYAGARPVLEKLLQMMPPGEERGEVEKVLAEMPQAGGKPAQGPSMASAATSIGQQITGEITVDPRLKSSVNSQAALFIIARSGEGGGGPPLAVRKIEHPAFPLTYSLGPENVMMQGTPFSGKVTITVRLDQDGNPITRQPGDLSGEYKKNPVDVGSKSVDVVLDQLNR